MNINNLTLAFGNKTILKDINLEIAPGEFVFLIGRSGSGKTSLIRSLIGDFEPLNGDIVLDDNSKLYLNTKKDKDFLLSYRRKLGVVFQDYKLLESKKVYENVAFAMEVCGYKDSYIAKKVPEILSQVGLLVKKDKFAYELSGGEQQRVAIARALVHSPDIIIGDEPTGNLDPDTAQNIMDIFAMLNKNGKTIIIASHDKNIVDKAQKRVISFKDKSVFSDENPGKYNL